jgi:serine/threonine-protein kinase
MTLPRGSRLGPYEAVAPIGAGGMGEVYRARDTKLNRDVALKILPESFALDADRLARFRREAQVLASLNHPNIGAIDGLEESNGTQALVLELVDGPTLADRIAQGPIPLDEALSIAKQLAEALEAAHEHGIIHRDLKPANIKVRPDGAVKVLDFGLAKALSTDGHVPSAQLTDSPTLTSPVGVTGAGVLLGTAPYMAPEQAKGKSADKRSDIWAFGCVLYEMLTGNRAFDGEDVGDTLAAVLRGEPDWNALPAALPPLVRTLIQGCLHKDYAGRVRDLSTARFVLNAPTRFAAVAEAVNLRPPLWRRVATHTDAWLVGIAMAGAGVWFAIRPVSPRVTRLSIATAGTAALSIVERDLTFTPDGSRMIYVGHDQTQLFVRPLDALEPIVVASGTQLRDPFVSPDGQWIGFGDGGALKKVAIAGGPAVTLTRIDGVLNGATWAPDDTIIFATLTMGLQSVSAAGGAPRALAEPVAGWPEILPGGRAVLFTIDDRGAVETAQVVIRDLRTGAQKVVVGHGSDAHYVSSGHLVYVADGALHAVSFDLGRMEVRGTPVPVVPQIVTTLRGLAGDYAVAPDGTLAYVSPSGAAPNARILVWVARDGQEQPITAPPYPYGFPRLSPDGQHIAVTRSDQEADIWIWDLKRASLRRLTSIPPWNSLRCGRRMGSGWSSIRCATAEYLICGGKQPMAAAILND